MLNESLGDVIRKWRERRGYSQVELGQLAALTSPSIVSRAEADKTLPTRENMEAIARVLAAEDELWDVYQRTAENRDGFVVSEAAPVIAIPDSLLASPFALIPADEIQLGLDLESNTEPIPMTRREEPLEGEEGTPNFVVRVGSVVGAPEISRSVGSLCCEYSEFAVDEHSERSNISRSVPRDAASIRATRLVTALHILPVNDRVKLSDEILTALQTACADLSAFADRNDKRFFESRIARAFAVPESTVEDFLNRSRPDWQLYLQPATSHNRSTPPRRSRWTE